MSTQQQLSSSDAAAAMRIRKDLERKDNPAFVGSMSRQGKGATLLCMTDADIPCTFAGFGDKKQASAGLLVVNCLMDGYTKVPIEFTKGDKYKQGPNPIPLSERHPWPADPSGGLYKVKMRPYGIVEGYPKDKAVAPEGFEWEVDPGTLLRASFWADAARGTPTPAKLREGLCPAGMDFIPAFSLVEVHVVSRGWSKWEPKDVNPDNGKEREICPVKKGYGMSIESIKVFEQASPYSVLDKLGMILPDTLDAMKARQQLLQNKFPSIKDLLQQDKVPFFVRAANTSTSVDLDERPEMKNEIPQIRLTGWCPESMNTAPEAMHPIDILHADAMAATNCPDIQSACALLEIAANAGALSIIVCCNQYRPGRDQIKSMLYGFPLVDTRILLKGVEVPPADVGGSSSSSLLLRTDETDNYFAFDATFEMLLPSATEPASSTQKKKKKKSGGGQDEEKGGDDDDVVSATPSDDGDNNREEESDADECTSMQVPLILVSKEPFAAVRGENVLKTPDFLLVGNNVQLAKGYYVRFVHRDLQSSLILWAGYINLTRPQITMPGASAAAAAGAGSGAGGGMGSRKRSRWSIMAASSSASDPFAAPSIAPSAGAAGSSDAKGRLKSVREEDEDEDNDDGNNNENQEEEEQEEDEDLRRPAKKVENNKKVEKRDKAESSSSSIKKSSSSGGSKKSK